MIIIVEDNTKQKNKKTFLLGTVILSIIENF